MTSRDENIENSITATLDPIRVTVAIVTYRSKGEIVDCVNSVLGSDIPVRVVVIDNDSRDGTFELASEISRQSSNVRVVSSGQNVGLAAGNNIVLPHVVGDYILMLNPDTIVESNTISTMVRILDGCADIGIVGPTNVYGDGSKFSSYQFAWNLWHVLLWRVFPYSLTRLLYDRLSKYRERRVFYVSGSCLLIRRSLFVELGGYDPIFFLTIEDVCDLCRRAQERGFGTLFTPKTQVIHFCSRSGSQVPTLTLLEGYKGSVHYFRKYNGVVGGASAFALVTVGCLSKIAMSALKIAFRRSETSRQHLKVYWEIFPRLLREGRYIAFGKRAKYFR
jgi:N-acetylglucosaminyl-diphospho-decaprenol L-rhamnosyltransferase